MTQHASSAGQAIGIDLGTTTCAAARKPPGGDLSCFLLEADRYLLPSALHFGEEVEAGSRALRRGLEDAEGFVEAFKRDMGAAHFHRQVRDTWVPPEVLSALLLDAVRKAVQGQAPARQAVITVPAYFDERRRKATLEAGRLAGLEVLDIVNEPVAAALAELHYAGVLDDNQAEKIPSHGSHFVIYDLGGGTFDVSVLKVDGKEITTLATDGDVRLGGRDFDQRIVDYVSERFRDRHGLDPRSDLALIQRLWRLAESAKHDLSVEEETAVHCSLAGMEMTVDLTRSTFVGLIAPLLERTLATATDAVEQAGLSWGKIDRVLLVGGSSRIPVVAKMIREATGVVPSLSHDPDLAVARGAAIFASLDQQQNATGLQVVNVNAHSLGVAGVDPQTGEGVNRIIIPRNSRLPAAKRQKFVTKSAGQKSIKIKIVEGENENPDYCVPVGTCVATLAPDLPARSEVLVTCRLGTNGTLSVSCHVPATDQGAHVEIRRDGLLELESLDVWRSRLLGRSIDDRAAPTADAPVAELPHAPPASAVGSLDHDAITRRVDYLCQEAATVFAERHLKSPGAEQALKHWQAAEHEHGGLTTLLTEVLSEMRREESVKKRTQLQSSAATIRVQLDEARNLLIYARVAFGGACLRHETPPEEAEGMADEYEDLMAALRE